MFEHRYVTHDVFVAAIDTDPANKFAKTFVAKADMLGAWDQCHALAHTKTKEIAGAVIWTISKRAPYVCNLQLLHTFAKFRGQGVGKILMDTAMMSAMSRGAQYFRVSSEPESVAFYEKIGYRFWGKQKSGCQLCIFKLPGIYTLDYDVIWKAIHRKGKGGVVELGPMYHDMMKRTQKLGEFFVD